jgi:hypothetical protein
LLEHGVGSILRGGKRLNKFGIPAHAENGQVTITPNVLDNTFMAERGFHAGAHAAMSLTCRRERNDYQEYDRAR